MAKKPIGGVTDPRKAEASLTLKHINDKIKKDTETKKSPQPGSGNKSQES